MKQMNRIQLEDAIDCVLTHIAKMENEGKSDEGLSTVFITTEITSVVEAPPRSSRTLSSRWYITFGDNFVMYIDKMNLKELKFLHSFLVSHLDSTIAKEEKEAPERAIDLPSFPCNSIPFLKRLLELLDERGTNTVSTFDVRIDACLIILIAQRYGQLSRVDVSQEYTRILKEYRLRVAKGGKE